MRIISTIAFIFALKSVVSQNLREHFYERINVSNNLAFKYCDSLLSSPSKDKAFAYAGKAFILSRQKKYDDANALFAMAYKKLELVPKHHQNEERLYILNFHALHLLARHEFESANKRIYEGLMLSEKLESIEMQIKFKNLLGRCMSMSGLDKEAIRVSHQTIKLLKRLRPQLRAQFFEENSIYALLNRTSRTLNAFLQDSVKNRAYIDSSIVYLNSYRVFIEQNHLKPNLEQQLQSLSLEADILFYKKEYRDALPIYNEFMNMALANELQKRYYQSKYRIAECYFYLNDLENAKKIFDTISDEDLDRFKFLKNKVLKQYYYAQIYLSKGEVNKAIKYTESFNNQIDGYYKQKSHLKINIFTAKELNEKKKILNTLYASKEKNKSVIIHASIIISLLIVTGIIHTIYLRHQKKILNVKIQHLIENTTSSKHKTVRPIKIEEQKAKLILNKLKNIEKTGFFKSKDFTLTTLAKKVGSNSTYVSKVISTYMDKSFIDYSNELRINAVLFQLKTDTTYRKYTLSAISDSVGYKSINSFYKHFKKQTGITPKQYIDYLEKNKV